MPILQVSPRCFLFAATVAGFFSAQPSGAQQVSAAIPADLGEHIAADFIRPTVAGFSGATGELVEAMSALCAAPGNDRLAAARNEFAATVTAWGRLSVLRFGPLVADDRFERVFFWPDTRGVTLRQVQELLADEEPNALSPAGLQEKSVALQGLPALEFVLHGGGAETLGVEAGSYRCRYGLAVADNLAGIADEVVAGWAGTSDFAVSFTRPSSDGNPYRSSQEVAGEAIKALATGLQFTSNAEIKPALGEAFTEANGNRAPLRRADLTFALMEAQLGGMAALLASTGWHDAAENGVGTIADSVSFDLDRAGETLASISLPAERAFESEEEWEKLRYATVALDFANRTLSEKLAGALGLAMGFNALDGD